VSVKKQSPAQLLAYVLWLMQDGIDDAL